MDRRERLNKFFNQTVFGKAKVTPNTSRQFLEAVCAQPDPAVCLGKLVSNPLALENMKASMSFNVTHQFLNESGAALLTYLFGDPALKQLSGGDVLNKVVSKLLESPLFWSSLAHSFKLGLLAENAEIGFAQLLLHLITTSGDQAASYRDLAKEPDILGRLSASTVQDVKFISHKIRHILSTYDTDVPEDYEEGPGGRHDNDFADFRKITILPTPQEIACQKDPFLRRSAELEIPETVSTRLANYIDNQFRLNREDLIYDVREELSIATGVKQRKRRAFTTSAHLIDVFTGDPLRRLRWAIVLKADHDFQQFHKVPDKDRRSFLKDDHVGSKILRHQSLACIIVGGQLVSLATVHRDEERLAKKPPEITLQLEGEATIVQTLISLRLAESVQILSVDTAFFASEPILKALQRIQEVPLSEELVFWKDDDPMVSPAVYAERIADAVEVNPSQDLRRLLQTPKSIQLDTAQAASLVAGLTQRVALIQGPPGTGKSFIGALLAKIIHDTTTQTILVVCYTNHALDQFLQDLIDIGIPSESMVRLGGRVSDQNLQHLTLFSQKRVTAKRTRADWTIINELKMQSEDLCGELERKFHQFQSVNPGYQEILMHIEFDYPEYFAAFEVPASNDGMTRVGKKGRVMDSTYLINQWTRGWDAGVLKDAPHVREAAEIWSLPLQLRRQCIEKWRTEILHDSVSGIASNGKDYDKCIAELARKNSDGDIATLRSKRIIGCTTTGAAKFSEDLRAVCPDVLLVEEAGEILESHILAALGSTTKHLILIGDHKQLRPKVNNYRLTVEKDEGYDLNRSLFERLVLKGFPHHTLTAQHRMRPEVSDLVRQLTYPELTDAPGTQNRAHVRGVQSNVVFINHDKHEDDFREAVDRRDLSSTSSKQNTHEVGMVLKIVKYLAQQGYGTDKMVVLTPYLGQLHKLRAVLKSETDPVLNDLDSYDLVKAGLLSPSAAKLSNKQLRLATIDNYQGEESSLVIISLTRSNAENDIGFMISPERLNVLLSRARDGLFIIGNANTFMHSRKGGELWTRLVTILTTRGFIYDGFPVKCEQHPGRQRILAGPLDFERHCPDGGCTEDCGTMLNCGLHLCPSKCHQLSDHSKMACSHLVYTKCAATRHTLQWKCSEGQPPSCRRCDKDKERAEAQTREDYERQQKHDAEQQRHDKELAEIERQIKAEQEAQREALEAEKREWALKQKKKDLEDMRASLKHRQAHLSSQLDSIRPSSTAPSATPHTSAPQVPSQTPSSSGLPGSSNVSEEAAPSTTTSDSLKAARSPSREEWQRRKDMDGASNDAIDSIMEMTGLEGIKAQILRILDKIDVMKRQGTDATKERLNLVLLGNPGTGKTTVARLYAKFLQSIQVLPGREFTETTGSRLANDGVPGAKKMLEDIVKAGGGAVFIDEAYQLAGEHNFGGSQVLDFLLAEMENQVGTIVFILAGYNKQMEKFFEHNPGLPSRVPYQLHFADYEDGELLAMFGDLVEKKYKRRMKIEGGLHGLYARVTIRRLGRGRGREGFGNARALQNMFSKICEFQAERLSQERREGKLPDDFLMVKEDLIGPEPSKAIVQSKPWKKLQDMIGLQSVKASVKSLLDMITTNYYRELNEKEPLQLSLNRVFIGSPGTGKTTVANLYGQILSQLRLLSNGEVVVKNPADFIGSALGQSEKNTKAILASTVGKVLVIDEAYMLYGGKSSGVSDPYKTSVIDTIVAEVQNVPGEDRCVLLLGYKDQIIEMFQNVNPGLSRRFDVENAFNFENFDDAQLRKILELKLKNQDLDAIEKAKDAAISLLSRARNRPNFGNAGEVENILGKAKERYQKRFQSPAADVVFEPQDFDPGFDRDEHASDNLAKLFEDVIGCEEIVEKLGNYQRIAKRMKDKGIDMRKNIPTNFVFKGPPGTGKTTTARKIGQVYYDMGFLSSTELVECSASDLVGQYVGQTGPKTRGVFEKALGKVLFIDEAYRLAEGHFAKEAMDELVGILTQESFAGKLVVVLAGYDAEINGLLSVNPGLSSRFPDQIVFKNMTTAQCLSLLLQDLQKAKIEVPDLDDPESHVYAEMERVLQTLSELPSWGNARDVKTLAKKMIQRAYISGSSVDDNAGVDFVLPEEEALPIVREMLSEQVDRVRNLRQPPPVSSMLPPPVQVGSPQPPSLAPPKTQTTTTIKKAPPKPKQQKKQEPKEPETEQRDPGVPDAIWKQLQLDKERIAEAQKRAAEDIQKTQNQYRETDARIQKLTVEMSRLAKIQAKNKAEDDDRKRRLEEARIKELEARAEKDRIAAEIKKRMDEEARERKREAQAQAKLRQMGVCVAGFQWIKQAQGYRCAGGSHYISNEQLGM